MFFKKNIAALEFKNQQLANELKQIFIVQAEENIEVYQAESGDYIFSYDGLMLDDMIAPDKVAGENFSENVPSDFSNNDIVVVFGLGAGFLFKHAVLSTNSNIILIEPKIDILRYCMEYFDFSEEFLKNNVCVFTDINDAKNAINKLYMPNKSQISVIYPEAYLQLLPDILGEFQSDITKIIAKN